jgi:hypothetical protein
MGYVFFIGNEPPHSPTAAGCGIRCFPSFAKRGEGIFNTIKSLSVSSRHSGIYNFSKGRSYRGTPAASRRSAGFLEGCEELSSLNLILLVVAATYRKTSSY